MATIDKTWPQRLVMEVSVRELKNHLSEYLRRAQAGEAIDVASRGRPVGRLMPPRAVEQQSDVDLVAQLDSIPGIHPGNGQRLRGGQTAAAVMAGTTEEVIDWVRGG